MTREEVLAKIKELEEYIKDLDNSVGYEDDKLFLLSTEEYKKYKNKIPPINCLWWLRSPGKDACDAAGVDRDGSRFELNFDVHYNDIAVRPALKLSFSGSIAEGTRITYRQFPFILIDGERRLFIAEVPIAFKRFDEKSNEYSTSEIRQFLKEWEENR